MDTETTLIGAVLDGRYRIDDRLGAGGMAEVYLATDQRLLDRQVAVKVPHAALLAEFGFKERFTREMESLIRLDHPRIVKVLDAGEHNGIPYVVMQYLSGGCLRTRLGDAGNKCTIDEVLTWLPAVAEGLDFLHSEDLIHRDVKPANILFDQSGNAFIADFGIAKILGTMDVGLTVTGTTPGTPFYMGPEISTGEPITGAYDQYALATMAYEALAGERPFHADTPMRLLFMKASDQAPSITKVAKGLPSDLAAAIMRGLSRNPAERFLCCESFARALATSAPTRPFQPSATNATIPLNNLRENFAAGSEQPAAPRSAALESTETQLPVPAPAKSSRWVLAVLTIVLILGAAGYGTFHFGLWPDRQGSWVTPSLVSCTPTHGSKVQGPEFEVRGVASIDLRSATVNGKAATVHGKTFQIALRTTRSPLDTSITLVSLGGESVEYPYKLLVANTGSADGVTPTGQTSTVTTANLQPSALKLASATPKWDEIVGREFTLRFEATQPIRRASVMGAEAEVVDGRTVSIPIRLTSEQEDGVTSPERHMLKIDLVDENGELRMFRHSVRADLSGPKIQTVDPDSGAATGPTADVVATVSEPLRSVKIAGQPATIHENKLGFQAKLAVPENGLEVEIELEDLLGNKSSTMYRLAGTAEWKLLELECIWSGGADSATLGGESSKPLRKVTINGAPGKILPDGVNFSAIIESTENGPNEFVIEMIDTTGARRIEKKTVTIDLAAPKLVKSTPGSGATVDSRFVLAGMADENLLSAEVDGRECKLEGKRFHIDMEMPGPSHVAKVELVDHLGNRATYEVDVKGDPSSLRFEISPPTKSPVKTREVDLQISANRHLNKVWVNEHLLKVTGKTVQHRLTLRPGTNKITIGAEDGFGNRVQGEHVLSFHDPKHALEFSSDLSLNVKYRLPNGRFATRGRVAAGRPPIRIAAGETWMIEPEQLRFDNRGEFTKLVSVLRKNKVPGLSLRKNRSKACDLLRNLPDLEVLILDHTPLGKNGLPAVASLAGLKSLTMIKTDVRGTGLHTIAGMKHLEHLHLEKLPKVKPGDITFLKNLPKLKTLVIKGLRINARQIAALGLDKRVQVTVTR